MSKTSSSQRFTLTRSLLTAALLTLSALAAACSSNPSPERVCIDLTDLCACNAAFGDPGHAEQRVDECSVASRGAGTLCCDGENDCSCRGPALCQQNAETSACACADAPLDPANTAVDSCAPTAVAASNVHCCMVYEDQSFPACVCEEGACKDREGAGTEVPGCTVDLVHVCGLHKDPVDSCN